MASTYLSKTLSASNRKTFTFSAWIKRSAVTGQQSLFSSFAGTHPSGNIVFGNSSYVWIYNYNGSTYDFSVYTDDVQRDVSGWYHIVIKVDTTQATASDRVKIYINGEEAKQYDTNSTYPSLNFDTDFNISKQHEIGGQSGVGNYFDGTMAHVHFIDGTAYDASAFGETDATTGIWKPKTAPSVTYGTNGFFLKFENSGAFGTDSSGNGNNFTVNGTMTQTIDTPSNVFCTLNPLSRYNSNPTFSNGNLSYTGGGGVAFAGTLGTFAVTQGKYYWEAKFNSTNIGNSLAGIQQVGLNLSTNEPQSISGGTVAFYNSGGGDLKVNGSNVDQNAGTYTSSDVMGIALNMDDGQISYYKNGTAIITNYSLPANCTEVHPFFAMYDSGGSVNFGNGYFGTTAVASANADDNGIGAFEYAPPTGFRALCTKSINAEEYS